MKEVALYPPMQMYLPLALCLAFLSIVTSAILSDNWDRLKGKVVPTAFFVALYVSFGHVGVLLVVSLVRSATRFHFDDFVNLIVHEIVLFAIAFVAIPLAREISKQDVEAAQKKLTGL